MTTDNNQTQRKNREKACEFAATVLSGRSETEALTPLAWSLCVFFETYLDGGADATRKAFGPKPPAKLKRVA